MLDGASRWNVAAFRTHFATDSLFRNSIYLMLSTVVQAVLGFAFWLLCARLFTPEAVGIGGTLISAVTFISYVSLLGFNSTLVRFLPGAADTHEQQVQINSGLTLVFLAALLISAAYVVLLPLLSPELAFIRRSGLDATLLLVLSTFSAVNLLTDSIFVALRAAQFNLLIYSIQSVLKLFLPLALLSLGGVGIFAATGLAASVAFFLSLYFVSRHFHYRPAPRIDRAIVARFWRFSSGNYLANLVNMVPIMAVPLIVINSLGAQAAGHYYLAFTICNLLYAVAYAVSQSMFAEGSHDGRQVQGLYLRSLRLMALIMVPLSVALMLLGGFILTLFGKDYSLEAASLLKILALASLPVGFYVLSSTLLRITGQIRSLILVNALYATVTVGGTFLWSAKLSGVGWAWLLGNLLAGVASVVVFNVARRPGQS